MQRLPGQIRRRPARRPSRPRGRAGALAGAQRSLRLFRQASFLALAAAGLILLLIGEPVQAVPVQQADDTASAAPAPFEPVEPASPEAREVARATSEQARGVLATLSDTLVRNLPRLLVATAALLAAWAVFRITRYVLRRVVPGWARANALTAVVGFVVWIVAAGVAVSVVAGDIRGMLGSVGLVGLALSWALQTPIESATAWLLNSFRGYYRVGDRIAVGEITGDVYRIDVLTTTLWEIGGADRPGAVRAEQPTGRLITVPNHELLRGSVVNYTRDFPWLWDEISVAVANESDLAFAAQVALAAVTGAIGAEMEEPARRYETLLRAEGLEPAIATAPEVFLAPVESWTEISVRYLVPARQRRRWKSELTRRVLEAFALQENAGRIFPGYHREQFQRIDGQGRPI